MQKTAYIFRGFLSLSNWRRRWQFVFRRELRDVAASHPTRRADYWHFLVRFAHRPWTIGAIAPSSARLARTVLNQCNFGSARTVVELGAGSGAITGWILRRLQPGTIFIALEIDPLQAEYLRKRFPGLIVCCESAENLGACLAEHGCAAADCIVSGLPWGNMSRRVQDRIMDEVVAALRPGGRFCGFGYVHASWFPSSRAFRQRLLDQFSRVRVSPVIWRNLPPAFAYSCA
ncbi:MAG TPA: methyltransferase domain-containing protein [Opitutaceae bacterium]|jgi:phospholipid N-methyltransferase|nr:methyltransferase domain-containing protein [Opitutaceae bacterium]